jgi:hypothetical protein
MPDIRETFERTMRSKAAIDAYTNYKKYRELIDSGRDPDTAFLQVFMGIYVLVPKEDRPDVVTYPRSMTLGELHGELKQAHAHYSSMMDEASEGTDYLQLLLKGNPKG